MGIMMFSSESFENLLNYNIQGGQFVEFKVLETSGFVFKQLLTTTLIRGE